MSESGGCKVSKLKTNMKVNCENPKTVEKKQKNKKN